MKYDIIGFAVAWVFLCVFAARIYCRVIESRHSAWLAHAAATNTRTVYRTDHPGDTITLAGPLGVTSR